MPPGRPGPQAATSSFLGWDADRPEALGHSAGIARGMVRECWQPDARFQLHHAGLVIHTPACCIGA
ncbi:hypothetical protein INR49_024835 [Caranx melampygus]|nr:hypothetical protein INR49_024835 [Caranx melampygus]